VEPTDGKASSEIRPWRGRTALDNPLRGWRGSHGITDRGLAPTATHGAPLRGENMLAGLGRRPVSGWVPLSASVVSRLMLYGPLALTTPWPPPQRGGEFLD
jgi:hypothetical protein